eukprot:TRINITY_DN777904_c0_g1_i1.p1 TRINITY_DN777904_c0_g1~~TRINITY_DN777904_c0_g1_i1.p1  ORF type:complete len:122 (-),score=8.40 TRINITY_DN777904_c0_g1_i1:143-508(-)
MYDLSVVSFTAMVLYGFLFGWPIMTHMYIKCTFATDLSYLSTISMYGYSLLPMFAGVFLQLFFPWWYLAWFVYLSCVGYSCYLLFIYLQHHTEAIQLPKQTMGFFVGAHALALILVKFVAL